MTLYLKLDRVDVVYVSKRGEHIITSWFFNQTLSINDDDAKHNFKCYLTLKPKLILKSLE